MRPSPVRSAVGDLKAIGEQLATLRRLAVVEVARDDLGQERRQQAEALLADSEKTYLARLFVAFEAGLIILGPRLSAPVTFTDADALKTKLDRIGSAMGMPQPFRDTIDEDVRKLRNEMLHGRTVVPRLSFEGAHDPMRRFYRGCH